jgi:hypothetical protein
MPRDGSGTYTRAISPYVNGDVLPAESLNAESDDIATALTGSLPVNGTKAMAANLPMGGNKVTGLAAGTTNGDAVRYEQLTALSGAYQPLDADLTALAALSSNGGVFRTGDGAYMIRSITGSTNITVSNGDGVSGAPTISASGLLVASNNLSDLASASTARTNLGLGTAATQNTGTSGAAVPLLNSNCTVSGSWTFSATPVVQRATQTDNVGMFQGENTGTSVTDNASFTTKTYSALCQFMAWENNGMRLGVRAKTNGGAGSLYLTVGNDSVACTIDGTSSNAVFAGTVTASSDVRLKEGVATIRDASAIIAAMRGVRFRWSDDRPGIHMGVIAQEVEAVAPELVDTDRLTGMKSVAYANITALLIEDNNALRRRIEALEARG